MKVSETPRQGRYGSEPKPMCCKQYMNKLTVRVPLLDHQNKPVGWICMKCGSQKLDKTKFDEIKDLFD
jgi:hypothetical protein